MAAYCKLFGKEQSSIINALCSKVFSWEKASVKQIPRAGCSFSLRKRYHRSGCGILGDNDFTYGGHHKHWPCTLSYQLSAIWRFLLKSTEENGSDLFCSRMLTNDCDCSRSALLKIKS